MLCIKPGEHGGNPLACAVAIEALKVVAYNNYNTVVKEYDYTLTVYIVCGGIVCISY